MQLAPISLLGLTTSRVAVPSAVLLLVFATSPASAQQAETADSPQAIAQGQKQFQQTCGFCHGAAAAGGAEGPSLILSALVRHDRAGDLIGQVIRQGRVSKGMPAFSFAPIQIVNVAAFLHARIKAADVRSATGHGNFTLKQLLTGNAQAGQQLFQGTGGCVACHSPKKDLAGIGKRYSPVDLQARMLYPSSGSYRTATVTLPSGSKVSGELLSLDAFNVSLKDAYGWYRSWPLTGIAVQVHDPLSAHVAFLDRCSNTDMHNLFAYLESLP